MQTDLRSIVRRAYFAEEDLHVIVWNEVREIPIECLSDELLGALQAERSQQTSFVCIIRTKMSSSL